MTNFNNMNSIFTQANKTATLVAKSFFNPKNVLISTPVFLMTSPIQGKSNKEIIVRFSYYITSVAKASAFFKDGLSNNSLKSLTNVLAQVYESTMLSTVDGNHSSGHTNSQVNKISVQLELVRQYQPYMDTSILAQYLAINLSTHGFNRVINRLLNAVPFLNPNYVHNGSAITGIKVQVSGLLTSQRNRSRKTVYTASAGTFNNSVGGLSSAQQTSYTGPTSYTGQASFIGPNNESSNKSPVQLSSTVVDYSTYTTKSGLGAYTVKV
jgi:hypothetical protein